MKPLCIVLSCLLALSLSACGGASSAPAASQAPAASSALEESPAPAPAESASSAAPERAVALELVQQDSGAQAGYEPRVTLYEDGGFSFYAAFYDGSATITGTYAQADGGYVLSPADTTAQGVAGSDVGEMTLSPCQGGYAYGGGQLGLTFDGAVFAPGAN